jgi:hypothetical protein
VNDQNIRKAPSQLREEYYPTREGGWGKKNYLYKGLNSILMKVEAAMRSVQQSHKLWHDPLFVTVDEADPVLSMLELLFLDWSSEELRQSNLLDRPGSNEVGVLASASGLF